MDGDETRSLEQANAELKRQLEETNKAMWALGRSEHELVFGFFASILASKLDEKEAEAHEVWRFSLAAPERAILQGALRERGIS